MVSSQTVVLAMLVVVAVGVSSIVAVRPWRDGYTGPLDAPLEMTDTVKYVRGADFYTWIDEDRLYGEEDLNITHWQDPLPGARDGWWPAFEKTTGGLLATGNANVTVSTSDGARMIGGGMVGIHPHWMNNNTVVYLGPNPPKPGYFPLGLPPPYTKHTVLPSNVVANSIVGGGGFWCAFTQSRAAPVLTYSTGFQTNQGLFPAMSVEGRVVGLWISGEVVLLDSYKNNMTIIDKWPGNVVNPDIQGDFVVWNRYTPSLRVVGCRLSEACKTKYDMTTQPAGVNEFMSRLIPIHGVSEPWILTYINDGALVRPWGVTKPIQIHTGINMYPDGAFDTAAAVLRVAYSTKSGDLGISTMKLPTKAW